MFAKAMSTRKFPTNFKKYLLDYVTDIYQGEHVGGGIPDVEAAFDELVTESAQIRRESMYLQVFFAWCLGSEVSDKHNELSYIEKYVGKLPTQRKLAHTHTLHTSNKLWCYIDGMRDLKDPELDPATSWYELHEAPWHSNNLTTPSHPSTTFYQPSH